MGPPAEGIPRTARRRRHNDAVAGILLDEVSVNAHIDANKLAHIAMADDDIIQGIRQG